MNRVVIGDCTLINWDCREVMREIAENSVDSIVCDPPYGLSKEPDIVEVLTKWLAGEDHISKAGGFMNRTWDSFVPGPATWREAYRVLKPGGYLLAFGSSRTSDLLAIALRMAGFEQHPFVAWINGAGFPKATNLSKMLDKAAGVEREVIGRNPNWRAPDSDHHERWNNAVLDETITVPATEAARQWDGWFYGKQSMKPAIEPILMFQKPPDRKMVENVLRWGTGALNIDGCRVGMMTEDEVNRSGMSTKADGWGMQPRTLQGKTPQGRWPANLVLTHHPECRCVGMTLVKANGEGAGKLWSHYRDGTEEHAKANGTSIGDENGMETVESWECHPDCPSHIFPQQTSGGTPKRRFADKTRNCYGAFNGQENPDGIGSTSGSAARFFKWCNWSEEEIQRGFYCAKAPKKERRGSKHPTVKPLALMRYLVRLVTPPRGTVLDPFCGSGTTMEAAKLEGFAGIGIEADTEHGYFEDMIRRLRPEVHDKPLPLFDQPSRQGILP